MFFLHSDPPSSAVQAAVDNVRAFWNANNTLFPPNVTLTVDPAVKLIEDFDGSLTDILTATTAPAAVVGTTAGAYSAASGVLVEWLTTTVHGSRRIRGKTFMVPCTAQAFQSDGTIVDAFKSAVQSSAGALRAASGPTLGVWSRPRVANPSHVPPITARTGLWAPATGQTVPDKQCVLRSRRD
jgi:hypothetical protein